MSKVRPMINSWFQMLYIYCLFLELGASYLAQIFSIIIWTHLWVPNLSLDNTHHIPDRHESIIKERTPQIFLLVLEGYGSTSRFFFRCCQQHSIKMMLMVFSASFDELFTLRKVVCVSLPTKFPITHRKDPFIPQWKQCKLNHPSKCMTSKKALDGRSRRHHCVAYSLAR